MMMKSNWRKFAVLLLPMLMQSLAHASLGESEASVETDRAAIHGVRRVSVLPAGRVHEITTDSNHIREWVRPDGVVFCVAWDGLAHPDLTVIFGTYYPEYLAAEQATPNPKGRAPKLIKSTNLFSIRGGHMRDVHGKACIPALVPPGFDLNQVE
jgi:hypothetical protein